MHSVGGVGSALFARHRAAEADLGEGGLGGQRRSGRAPVPLVTPLWDTTRPDARPRGRQRLAAGPPLSPASAGTKRDASRRTAPTPPLSPNLARPQTEQTCASAAPHHLFAAARGVARRKSMRAAPACHLQNRPAPDTLPLSLQSAPPRSPGAALPRRLILPAATTVRTAPRRTPAPYLLREGYKRRRHLRADSATRVPKERGRGRACALV